MITIRRQSARQTKMPAILERLANLCATDARLRSASRVDLNKYTPGAFSLVRDHVQKLSPASIINRLCQHSRSQAFCIQILDRYQPKIINQATANFVVEVAPLRLYVAVGALQENDRLAPSIRALLTPRQSPLGDTQRGVPVPIVSRILNGRTVAKRGEVSQPNIDPESRLD